MRKYLLPTLLTALISGLAVNSAYAAEQGDVDNITMNVIDHSDPQDVTNNIQLPTQASQTAQNHVSADSDDSKTPDAQDSNADSQENATEDANENSQATAAEDANDNAQASAQEDAHQAAEATAEEQANQAMQDTTDTTNMSEGK